MRSFLAVAALSAVALLGQDFKLGSKVSEFTVHDLGGAPVQFTSLRGPVTVVTFISTQCPVSNSYNDRMNALYKEYSARGVKFVFLNANSNEAPAQVADHAKQHFSFPVYKDENNVVADRFGASVTPEAFVIDESGVVQYHGSVDDSPQVQRVQEPRLRNAIDAVLAGKKPERAETKAFGCSIKRMKKES